MKSLKISISIVSLFCFSLLPLRAQNNAAELQTKADAILIEAMKDSYSFNSEEKSSQNYQSYFASDRFESDAQAGKWSFGIDVIVDDIPIGLSADSNHDDRHAFQEKIKSSKKVYLTEATKTGIAHKILNPKVLEQYVTLVKERNNQYGFVPSYTQSSDGSTVTFIIKYNSPDNTSFPKIRRITIDGGDTIEKKEYYVGKQIRPQVNIPVKRNGNHDITLCVDTSTAGMIPIYANFPNQYLTGIPLGSIIFSMLPPNRFAEATGDHSNFDARTATWVPADGRNVDGAQYAGTISSVVPDLRGMFIRGMNEFSSGNPRRDGKQDSRDRPPGDYQVDTYKTHSHSMGANGADSTTMVGSGNPINTQRLANFVPNGFGDGPKKQTDVSGDAETQPKNISGYWYVKIN